MSSRRIVLHSHSQPKAFSVSVHVCVPVYIISFKVRVKVSLSGQWTSGWPSTITEAVALSFVVVASQSKSREQSYLNVSLCLTPLKPI